MFNFFRRSNKKIADRIHPKSRKKIKIIFAVIVFTVFIGLVIFLNSRVLIVKDIGIKKGVSCVENDRVVRDGAFTNQNILFLNHKIIEKKLKEKYLCIDSIVFEKKYPDKLLLDLKERDAGLKVGLIKGEALVKLPEIKDSTPSSEAASFGIDPSINEASVSGVYIVDKNGFVFDAASSEIDLPTIYLVGYETGLGRPINKKLVSLAVQLINRLKDLSIGYKSIKVMGDTVLVDGDVKFTFSLDKDLNRQLASLQLILQKAKMNSKSMEKIDLRFDKPVVIYSEREN